MILRRCWF